MVPNPLRSARPPVPPYSVYGPWKVPPLNVAENGDSMVPEEVPDEVVTVPVNVFCPKNIPLPVERLTMIMTLPWVTPLKAPVKQRPKFSVVIKNPSTLLVTTLVGRPVGTNALLVVPVHVVA